MNNDHWHSDALQHLFSGDENTEWLSSCLKGSCAHLGSEMLGCARHCSIEYQHLHPALGNSAVQAPNQLCHIWVERKTAQGVSAGWRALPCCQVLLPSRRVYIGRLQSAESRRYLTCGCVSRYQACFPQLCPPTCTCKLAAGCSTP